MRITKLSLTNFRSFKETQTIEFAPVTLLFGPNSVGKSTVLMALFYLQQILEKGQCNPQILDALGDKFVGGFKNLVNGRDISKRIKIKVEYDKHHAIGSQYTTTSDLINELITPGLDVIISDSAAASSNKVAVEFVIAWSHTTGSAFIESYSVWLDDNFVGTINSDAGLKNPIVSSLNFSNQLFDEWNDAQNDWLDEIFHNSEHILSSTKVELFDTEINNDDFVFEDHFAEDGLNNRVELFLQHQLPFGVACIAGALPVLGKKLTTSLTFDSELNGSIIVELLSELFVSPLDNLLDILNNSLCIGPLRKIPNSTYEPNPYPKQGDWYSGQACWDELAITNIRRDHNVNEWLGSEKLDLGYKLIYRTQEGENRFITPSFDVNHYNDLLAISDAIGIQIEQVHESDESEPNIINYENLEADRESKDIHSSFYKGLSQFKHTSVTLWDTHNSIDVTASDIGVGVSQLLPLVVAIYSRNKGVIACEQPELHVHPRVQVAIGDLLTQANTKAGFLIETHSEHLVLRMLKRIRQTTADELPDGFSPVTTDDISITYLEPSANGVLTKKFKVTDDGDFENDWPGGFFDERDEELF
ncbi:AAA family ATPase [Shewanella sp. 10N.286.51.B2]|uniref:AAA family ATPase n=1 Tax=Shewanella sp. 10N.286.51.B2 TaxID=3229707 RepID=UPI0035544AC0